MAGLQKYIEMISVFMLFMAVFPEVNGAVCPRELSWDKRMVFAKKAAIDTSDLVSAAEEKKAVKIEALYNLAKDNFIRGNYQIAILKFNRVIELEKELYPVYSPYAQEYIKQIQQIIDKRERERLEGEKPKEPQPPAEYTIGEDDVLQISVWQEETLDKEVIVRPDGRISFPLAGDVLASGLTFTQLKEELSQRLKDYIKYPEISISLKKVGGRKVIVLGEVNSPGVYPVIGDGTVLEAVALAGGFTQHAVTNSTILVRGGLQNPNAKRLNLARAIKKADNSQNLVLQPQDIIFVPKKFIADFNYVISNIIGPISQGSSMVNTMGQ